MKVKILCAALFSLSGLVSRVTAQTADNTPLKLRVGTYNVGHFNQGVSGGLETRGAALGKKEQNRYARMEMLGWREWIGAQNLDFFCVQEWNHYFDMDSTILAQDELLKPYYNNVLFGDKHKWIYNGIATNYHLTNLRQKYWFGDYYALIGDLKIGNKVVTVISTHIPWQKQWHAQAMDSIRNELKKYEYFICMGDINAADEEQLSFEKAGFNIANGGYQGWFTTAGGRTRMEGMKDSKDWHIDNIITSKNIKIMNVSAPHTGLNDFDHLPVLADLVITW